MGDRKSYGEWAEGGTANDPGTTQQADGYVQTDVPAYDALNWMLREQGRYLKAIVTGAAGQVFHANQRVVSDSPFDTDVAEMKLTYDPQAKWWYCAVSQAIGNDAIVYDSETGEAGTWSAGNTIDAALAVDENLTEVVSNGTICCVGADGNAFVSSDNTVANLGSANAFASIVYVRAMAYSPADALFVAVGVNGTTGHVETSPDGVTWTNRVTDAGFTCSGVAITSDGYGCVVADDTTATYYMNSGDSTTWYLDGSNLPSTASHAVHFCEALTSAAPTYPGTFFANSATSQHFSSHGYPITWGASGFNYLHSIITPEFMYLQNNSSGAALEITYSYGGTSAAFMISHVELPTRVSDSFKPSLSGATGTAIWRGGGGKAMYINVNDELVISNYGAL